MTGTTLFQLAATATLATACYGSAPPRPPAIPLPPDNGSEIEVQSITETKIEDVAKTSSTCPQGHAEGDPACVVTHYTVPEPVTRTRTTARRGDQDLSYAQFSVITDSKWQQKLTRLDDLRHKCTRANVPRYAGLGLLAAGVIIGAATAPGVMYLGAIAGGGAYAVGYYGYGGKDCVRARQLHDSMDFSRATGWMEVEGGDYSVKMKDLADHYNVSRGSHAQASR